MDAAGRQRCQVPRRRRTPESGSLPASGRHLSFLPSRPPPRPRRLSRRRLPRPARPAPPCPIPGPRPLKAPAQAPTSPAPGPQHQRTTPSPEPLAPLPSSLPCFRRRHESSRFPGARRDNHHWAMALFPPRSTPTPPSVSAHDQRPEAAPTSIASHPKRRKPLPPSLAT